MKKIKEAEDILKLVHFHLFRKLPVIRQTEASECGLACLAMLASYYGWRTDIIELRKVYPLSLNGSNLQGLMYIANKMNFSSRALRAKLSALNKLNAPCILHWKMNHFVVLKKATRDKIVIHDPEQGVQALTLKQASPFFTGVAVEFHPTEFFNNKAAPRRMKLSDLWSGIWGLKKAIGYTFLLSAFIQILALAMPFYMQIVVDEVLPKYDDDLLFVVAAGFALLMLINVGVGYMRSVLMLYVGSSLNIQMTRNLFHHLMHLPMQWFEKRHMGDILSRFGSTKPIGRLFSEGIAGAIIDGVMAISTGVIMMIYSPRLAAIVIAAIILFAVVRFALYGVIKSRQQSVLVAEAKEETAFIESVTAIQTVKIFGREYEREGAWINRLVAKVNNQIGMARIQIVFDVFRGMLFGLENILVVYFGAQLIFANALSIGMLFAFMAYKQQFSANITTLIERLFEFKMLSLHLERVADIAFENPEVNLDAVYNAADGAIPLRKSKREFCGKIELRDVWFKYGETDPWILKGVSFTIEPGEMVVITGASGGGKTTLLKLILGLATPGRGQILVDDVPLASTDIQKYRQSFGTVMQQDALMSGTIADNISFFDQNVNMDRIEMSARWASINGDIENLPMKYDTLIGHMGSSLSGGQQQRLLLARAFYSEPTFLVMDEGTANLDAANEQVILNTIKALETTRITVAHKEAVIRSADRLLIVEAGQIRQMDKALNLPARAG